MSFGLIILVFSICWTPLCITMALSKYMEIQVEYFLAFAVLSCFSAAMNPILYAYRMSDFRVSAKSMFYRIFLKNK